MSLATRWLRYAKQRSMASGIPEGEEMRLFSRARKSSLTTAAASTDEYLCVEIQSVRKQIAKVIPKRLDETVGTIKRKIRAISPIKSSFEPVKRREEDVGKEKESLERVVHEGKGSLEVYHDEEAQGLEREASTSQNPGSSISSTTASSDPTRHSSTLTTTRIMRMKSIPMNMCLTIP